MSAEPPRHVSCPRCGNPAAVYPTLPTHVHCVMCGLVELEVGPPSLVA